MVSRYYGLSVAISKIREITVTDLEGTIYTKVLYKFHTGMIGRASVLIGGELI
ncbi:hypothetical protein IMY50_30120 (plasmid) [Bacillus cereus]|nr:hypothetical protein [Bacillus cereus]QWS01170.1 hypothetical protein IMY50_30120 [Bacillus cereus]